MNNFIINYKQLEIIKMKFFLLTIEVLFPKMIFYLCRDKKYRTL